MIRDDHHLLLKIVVLSLFFLFSCAENKNYTENSLSLNESFDPLSYENNKAYFVNNLFKYQLLRLPLYQEFFKYYDRKIISFTDCTAIVDEIFNSSEASMIRKELNNSDFLNKIFLALLQRPIDEPSNVKFINYFQEKVEPHIEVKDEVLKYSEFVKICTNLYESS